MNKLPTFADCSKSWMINDSYLLWDVLTGSGQTQNIYGVQKYFYIQREGPKSHGEALQIETDLDN